MKAYDVKKGNVVEHDGTVYQVRDIERSSPQGRGGNVKFRFTLYSVPGGSKYDLSLGSDDELKEVELTRRQATFSYKDGDAFVFMDDEDFTPYALDADVVGDAAGYISDGLAECHVQIIDEQPVALQLPQSVALEVIDTPPELKGGTATKRRSEEHTSELQSLLRISYAVFCLKKQNQKTLWLNVPRNTIKKHR